MRVTLLGTGTSVGIPIIGCRCRVCTSTDERDVRTRCACLIQTQGLTIVIDTGPDFRQQMLRAHVDAIDAVLFTHHHYDHVAGLDDLRPYFFTNRTPMPCYANDKTQRTLQRMFPWIFDAASLYGPAPKLRLESCAAPFVVRSRYGLSAVVPVVPIPLRHDDAEVVGYRIGRFAYLTDTSQVPEGAYTDLRDLDVLVIDALRHEPHRKHLTIGEAVAVASRLAPRQTYLIHMTHSVRHADEDARLPRGVTLGYDGLAFEVCER